MVWSSTLYRLPSHPVADGWMGVLEADSPVSFEERQMPQPRMMFYHDGRHPLIYMYEPPMQKEEFEAGVDELAGTPVDAIMFCLGDGRTFLHDTKVG